MINLTPVRAVPSAVQNLCANALTMSGSVWERQSPITADLLLRLSPWQPGDTVKKHSSLLIQPKPIEAEPPCPISQEQFDERKKNSGMRNQNWERIRNGLEQLSLNTKPPSKLYETMRADKTDIPTVPMPYQSQTQRPY